MDINQRKDQVQNECLTKWITSDKTGTAEIITGVGKTFLGLKALYTMPRHTDATHLFLAEQKDRETDLEADILKFNEINNKSIPTIYGSVTNGTVWRFLQLTEQTVTIDFTDYPLPPVDVILGILVWMVTAAN